MDRYQSDIGQPDRNRIRNNLESEGDKYDTGEPATQVRRVGATATPVRLGSAATPVRLGSAATQVRLGEPATPVRLGATATPVRLGSAATPVRLGATATATPVRLGATATPVRLGATVTATPARLGATATPVRLGATATPATARGVVKTIYFTGDKRQEHILQQQGMIPIFTHIIKKLQEGYPANTIKDNIISILRQLQINLREQNRENDKNLVLIFLNNSEKDIIEYITNIIKGLPKDDKPMFNLLKKIIECIYHFISLKDDIKQEFTLSDIEKEKEKYNEDCIHRIEEYFTIIFLKNIIKLNNESGKIPLYNIIKLDAANDPVITTNAQLFDDNLEKIGQIIQMSDPNLETYLLKEYIYENENGAKRPYTSEEIIEGIAIILAIDLEIEVKHMVLFNSLPGDIRIDRLKNVITNCNTKLLQQNQGKRLPKVPIKYQNGKNHNELIFDYLKNENENGKLKLTSNGELNFGIFNYYFAKEFSNVTVLPKFTMTQWIILMNRSHNYNLLFFDKDKKIDLINRVRLIFKEMYMRQSTEIILLDGHGRTIFLLIQFMHVYNYKFNIKVYEISEPTHLWHEDFFPTLVDPSNNVLVNIRDSIEQLISTPELCQANLPNRLVYLNFCGIDHLYLLILNFIKKYKDFVPQNFSLWISSIVTRTDAGYLYNISKNPGSISNFYKIGILLYISFISSGNTIGESDKIPVNLIKQNLYDTSLSLDFTIGNQIDIPLIKDQLKNAFLKNMDDEFDASGNSILEKLVDRIVTRQQFNRRVREEDDKKLQRVIDSVMTKNFYRKLISITPEQKCVVRRGGDKSNQPNKGQSFVTFRIDINRLREFENINRNLVLNPGTTWNDFFTLFRNRYGFVPKYFLKYLKYKQKYLNLVEKLKNRM